jgi:hypothetical protein
MRLSLTIEYDVEDSDPEKKEIVEEIVGEEARGFAEAVRQRLAAQGVTDLSMSLNETNQ